MKYMTVKGEKLSQLGLGTWNMGESQQAGGGNRGHKVWLVCRGQRNRHR